MQRIKPRLIPLFTNIFMVKYMYTIQACLLYHKSFLRFLLVVIENAGTNISRNYFMYLQGYHCALEVTIDMLKDLRIYI